MLKRIVQLAVTAVLATMNGQMFAQELNQPVAGYSGPQLKPLTAAAPTNQGDKEYVPTGNLCVQTHAWEKATGHELKLGEPIEVSEWRQMVIAGGSTGWVWVPAGTKYWEFNGKALFFGPMPDNKDVPRNRGTGCCNPVGEGSVPNPEPVAPPVVAVPLSIPAPVAPPKQAVVQVPALENIQPLPPAPVWQIRPFTVTNITVQEPKKGHGKLIAALVAVGGAVAIGVVYEATHKGHSSTPAIQPSAAKPGGQQCTPDPYTGTCH